MQIRVPSTGPAEADHGISSPGSADGPVLEPRLGEPGDPRQEFPEHRQEAPLQGTRGGHRQVHGGWPVHVPVNIAHVVNKARPISSWVAPRLLARRFRREAETGG